MHIIYGTMVALTLKLNLPLFLIFTNLPDLDGITDIFTKKLDYHRYALHNIFSFFLMLIIGSFFFSFKLIFFALTLHYFLDLINTYGIALFYPFSRKRYRILKIGKYHGNLLKHVFYEGSPFFTIISLIIFIIFLLFYFF